MLDNAERGGGGGGAVTHHSTFFSPGSGLGSINCNVLSRRAAALDAALARPPPAEEVIDVDSNSSFLLLFIGFQRTTPSYLDWRNV